MGQNGCFLIRGGYIPGDLPVSRRWQLHGANTDIVRRYFHFANKCAVSMGLSMNIKMKIHQPILDLVFIILDLFNTDPFSVYVDVSRTIYTISTTSGEQVRSSSFNLPLVTMLS